MSYVFIGILFFSVPLILGLFFSLYMTKLKANIYANAFKNSMISNSDINNRTNDDINYYQDKINKKDDHNILINILAFIISLILVFSFLYFCSK